MPNTFAHEVESQFQRGQLGIESVYGTAVAATIALGSVTITPAIREQVQKFTPRGRLLPTLQILGRQHTQMRFDGHATYQELGYFLKSLVSDAQTDPIASSMVYTVEAGGMRIPGSFVSAVTLKGNRDEIKLSGTMMGKMATVPYTPTAGLTIPGQTPVLPASVAITIDSVSMTKAFEWELALADLWGGATFIGSSTFVNMLQKLVSAKFSLKTENDSVSTDLLAKKNQVLACNITAASGAHTLSISFNAAVAEPGTFSDEEGVYAVEHNLNVMNTAGSAITVAVS